MVDDKELYVSPSENAELRGLSAWLPEVPKKYDNPSNLEEFFHNISIEEAEDFFGVDEILWDPNV